MWKDVEYNSWKLQESLEISSHGFIVIYDYCKGTFIPLWKNIDYCWIWRFMGGEKSIREYFKS